MFYLFLLSCQVRDGWQTVNKSTWNSDIDWLFVIIWMRISFLFFSRFSKTKVAWSEAIKLFLILLFLCFFRKMVCFHSVLFLILYVTFTVPSSGVETEEQFVLTTSKNSLDNDDDDELLKKTEADPWNGNPPITCTSHGFYPGLNFIFILSIC